MKATKLGIQKYSWWPDWREECVAILASGPSIKKVDLNHLKDRIHIIAVKETIDLFPQAEVLYGCDGAWWRHRKGMGNFQGIKIAHDAPACNDFKLIRADISIHEDKILLEEPLKIGSGGNSGFQAMNLAVQFGATGVLLVGFDMNDNGGVHYYGRNKWQGANNPMGTNFSRWKKAFEGTEATLKKLGVDVINASMTSSLKIFRIRAIEQALEEWGL